MERGRGRRLSAFDVCLLVPGHRGAARGVRRSAGRDVAHAQAVRRVRGAARVRPVYGVPGQHPVVRELLSEARTISAIIPLEGLARIGAPELRAPARRVTMGRDGYFIIDG